MKKLTALKLLIHFPDCFDRKYKERCEKKEFL